MSAASDHKARVCVVGGRAVGPDHGSVVNARGRGGRCLRTAF